MQCWRMANLPTFSVSEWIVTTTGPALRARGFRAANVDPSITRLVARPHRAPWRWRTLRRLPGLPSVTNRLGAFRTDGTAFWRWRWLAELEGERSEESGEGGPVSPPP